MRFLEKVLIAAIGWLVWMWFTVFAGTLLAEGFSKMAISLVGTPQVAGAPNGTSPTLTFNVTPQEGDYVFVFGGHTEWPTVFGPTTAGYTPIESVIGGSQIEFGAWYKKMGSSPDTSVQCRGTSVTQHGCAYGAYVLRGVDPTTPLDVAATKAGVSSTGQPDCPSIDPVTPDCWILALMGCRNADASITGPSGYTNFLTAVGSDNVPFTIFGATKFHSGTHAAEDPPATTNWGEGANWGAITVAVRPAADAPTGTLASTLAGDTLAAEGVEKFEGALAATLGGDSLAAAGTETISGELAATLEDATIEAEGEIQISGEAAPTLDDATLEAIGTLTFSGSVGAQLDDATIEAEGAVSGDEARKRRRTGSNWEWQRRLAEYLRLKEEEEDLRRKREEDRRRKLAVQASPAATSDPADKSKAIERENRDIASALAIELRLEEAL